VRDRLVDPCSHLPETEQGRPAAIACGRRDQVSPHQETGRDLKGNIEWKQVCNQGSKRTLSLPTTPPQVPLHNRYEALAVDDWSVEDVNVNPYAPEELQRTERLTPVLLPHPEGRIAGS